HSLVHHPHGSAAHAARIDNSLTGPPARANMRELTISLMNTFLARRFKFRRVAVCLCAAALATCVACGGDKGGDNGGGGGGAPTRTRNGARIGWSQAAGSQDEIQ